jgi:hypothetical protein
LKEEIMLVRNLVAAMAVVATGACEGAIEGRVGAPTAPPPAAMPSVPPIGGGPPAPSACDGGRARTGPTPLRRLTRLEYDNTVRDLLGDGSRPASAFVADEKVAGFAANAVAPVDEGMVERYLEVAGELARRAVASGTQHLFGCAPDAGGCVESFVRTFGQRAFRRPLDPSEGAALVARFGADRSQWGADVAAIQLLQTMLASPHFLYHLELGGEGGAPRALGSFELASRLSYFLWQSMPDDALFAAAAVRSLDTSQGIEAQARRMMADPRFAEAIGSFHEQWLHLGGEHGEMADLQKDPRLFPRWNKGLAQALEKETMAFADQVIRQGDGRIETLLSASYTFGNAAVAAHYGAPAPAGGFGRITLDPRQRAGLLTHGSFLASQAHPTP